MRKARSLATFLRDNAASRSAQANYRARAAYLREQAHQLAAEGKPLNARIVRYQALIAEHAAQAEFMDPDA